MILYPATVRTPFYLAEKRALTSYGQPNAAHEPWKWYHHLQGPFRTPIEAF